MAEKNEATSPPQEQHNEFLPWNYNQFVGENLPKKTSWPELVGVTAEEARRKILEDMPEAQVFLVHPFQFVPQDFQTNRVWLLVDKSQKIWQTPSIG